MWMLLALAPSLAFGSMTLLTMKLHGDQRQQTLGMMTGGLIVASILAIIVPPDVPFPLWLVAMGCGFLLCMGIHFQIMSFHAVGVSRAMPVSTGAQLALMSLLGVLVLGEWRTPGALPVGVAALIILAVGVTATTWVEKGQDKSGDGIDWRKGTLYLILSTIPLVIYLIIFRWFAVDAVGGLLPLLLGCVVGALIFTFPQFTPYLGEKDTRWQRSTLWQLIPGVVWCTGLVLMQIAVQNAGVATGFTLSQLGVVISAIGGIVLLGESRTKKELVVLAGGILLLVVGVILIGVAKAIDAGGIA